MAKLEGDVLLELDRLNNSNSKLFVAVLQDPLLKFCFCLTNDVVKAFMLGDARLTTFAISVIIVKCLVDKDCIVFFIRQVCHGLRMCALIVCKIAQTGYLITAMNVLLSF